MKPPSPRQIEALAAELVQRQVLWSLLEAAQECGRSHKTLLNLISKHHLPIRRSWITRLRARRRNYTLSATTVAELVLRTRLAPDPAMPTGHPHGTPTPSRTSQPRPVDLDSPHP